jgi:hypothetical protein
MKHLKTFESHSKVIGYHITFKHLIDVIKEEGLKPQVPSDMEDIEAVYLFKTIDDAKNALMNWLGERIEEMEEEQDMTFEELCLEIDLTGLEIVDTVEYEWACLDLITPDRILSIFEI